jgi:hypothetical protein
MKIGRITQGLRLLTNTKGACIYSRSSNNPHMTAFYVKYCKIPSRVMKEAKRHHYCRLLAKSDNQINTTCNIIKHETGKF